MKPELPTKDDFSTTIAEMGLILEDEALDQAYEIYVALWHRKMDH